MSHCEYLDCTCQNLGGIFWHTGTGDDCDAATSYGCILHSGEFECSAGPNATCAWIPAELKPPPEEDPFDRPAISDADQVAEPVKGGSGVPGAIGGGPGATELVETETGHDTGIFNPAQFSQTAELSPWIPPDEYGHGEAFQMDAFLSDAPLDYLEALLDLQASGAVRADVPVAYYYALKLEGDCNGNGIPDAFDIEDGTSLDLDQDGTPDACQQAADTDDFDTPTNPDPIVDLPEHIEDSEADLPVTASDDWTGSPSATEAHTDGPAIYTDTHSNSPPTLQAQDTGPSSDMCGSGVGLAAVMLSLCWMFVGMGRIGRRGRHTGDHCSNSIPGPQHGPRLICASRAPKGPSQGDQR